MTPDDLPVGTRVVADNPKWLSGAKGSPLQPHRTIKPGMTGTVSGLDPMNPEAVSVIWDDLAGQRYREIYIWADGLERLPHAPIHDREELEQWLDS